MSEGSVSAETEVSIDADQLATAVDPARFFIAVVEQLLKVPWWLGKSRLVSRHLSARLLAADGSNSLERK